MDNLITPLPSSMAQVSADPVEDVPRILQAMRLAVREAIQAHKRAGNPIAVWRDGRVVWLEPHEIPDDVPAK